MRIEGRKTFLCDLMKTHLQTGANVRVPEWGTLIWRAFVAIGATRSYHQSGPNPVTFQEINAWLAINRLPLQEHHVAMIRALDDTWIAHWFAQRAQSRGTGKTVQPPAGEMNTSLFDAMFG